MTDRCRRRLDIVRLVLAGPDPASIQDDPEGKGVLEDLVDTYLSLEPEIQRQVILLTLPMDSRKENALMVNTLQRCSSIIVQNSLREGFGLTATEAMWKRTALMGTRACGLRAQIRDQIDGRLVQDAENPDEIAATLHEMLDLSRQNATTGPATPSGGCTTSPSSSPRSGTGCGSSQPGRSRNTSREGKSGPRRSEA